MKQISLLRKILLLVLSTLLWDCPSSLAKAIGPESNYQTFQFSIVNHLKSTSLMAAESDCCNRGKSNGTKGGDVGGIHDSIPYVITPRNTWIQNSSDLTIQWNCVSGITKYSVKIENSKGELWWDAGQDLECRPLTYNGKPFVLGDGYSVTVTVKDDSKITSNERLDTNTDLTFNLLEPETVNQVQKVADLINKQGMSEEAKALSLAYVYLKYGLRADAIAYLEATKTKNLEIYILLGETYDRISLTRLAIQNYSQALELARQKNDRQALATIQGNLGEIYFKLNNKDQAVKALQEAISAYETLNNNSQRLNRLRELLKKMQ